MTSAATGPAVYLRDVICHLVHVLNVELRLHTVVFPSLPRCGTVAVHFGVLPVPLRQRQEVVESSTYLDVEPVPGLEVQGRFRLGFAPFRFGVLRSIFVGTIVVKDEISVLSQSLLQRVRQALEIFGVEIPLGHRHSDKVRSAESAVRSYCTARVRYSAV